MKDNPKVWYWLARAIYHFPAEKVQGKTFNPVESARTILMKPDIAKDATLICFLGRLCEELGDTSGAIAAYKSSLKLQPDNTEVMNLLGLIYLRTGQVQEGFVQLGNCLAYDPANSQAILTIGSIMQNHSDHDVALNKYRVAADVSDYNGCLWNNIGIGLLARNKPAASHSALKKAAFINPLNYKISYNLGVLHDIMNLHCSALHYIKLCTELYPQNAKAVGAMAVILSHMNDDKNARLAYKKSIELKKNPSTILNYAIFEYRMKDVTAASNALKLYKDLQASGVKCSANNKETANLLESVLKQPDQSAEQ
ncbi:BBSome complex member bbs-4 [Caenorhabditis elegans]|nr:Bardet-Biedl syndrome 4 protein homolog [Caenorhabditis elegans]CCD31086.1 Bardet-Biedl syndrome 4 protein homolog [Caenorhabditis elegans]|eukprot:NP_001255014.1 Bardet-Biedl syndrome 4 protein homolog [Caenorhabditis elegans]